MKELVLSAREREKAATEVPQGGWASESRTTQRLVPTPRAEESYQRAQAMAREILLTADAKELLALHDLLAEDPMKDLGESGFREVFEAVRSRIVDLFRQRAFPSGGWGFG